VKYLSGDLPIAAVEVGTSAPPRSTLSPDPLLKPFISFERNYLPENHTLNALLYKGSSIHCLGEALLCETIYIRVIHAQPEKKFTVHY